MYNSFSCVLIKNLRERVNPSIKDNILDPFPIAVLHFNREEKKSVLYSEVPLYCYSG